MIGQILATAGRQTCVGGAWIAVVAGRQGTGQAHALAARVAERAFGPILARPCYSEELASARGLVAAVLAAGVGVGADLGWAGFAHAIGADVSNRTGLSVLAWPDCGHKLANAGARVAGIARARIGIVATR